MSAVRRRNDPAIYEELAGSWWAPRGPFAMLAWIARARAALVPDAQRRNSVLVDLGCGGGLMAPYVAAKGYRHLGVDTSPSALSSAAAHGVLGMRSDVAAVPLPDACAAVVCAGEILEHVEDLEGTIAEVCRLLAPKGVVVIDTIADTLAARLLAISLAERVPGGAPPGIHDPELFVDRRALQAAFAARGVTLSLNGLRPCVPDALAFLAGRRDEVRMVPSRSTAVLFQAVGTKAAGG
ncbi:MAG: methyltransferase domain-containing protein [Actinomycetota bacterium]|nr:methyltransferase domain-containing protein [Actinomycetota bacterium]